MKIVVKFEKCLCVLVFLIAGVTYSQKKSNNDLIKTELKSLKREITSLKKTVLDLKENKKQIQKKKWYDKISMGGYIQLRYNELFESNPNLKCEQCDHFWGDDSNGLSFRRVRFKISGYITPRVYFYLQPDYAKTVGGKHHVGALKDAFFDVGIDKDNEYRIRFGQSKVPYGYENLQSSSNRLPLDRNDGTNSGVKDERDLGVFLYWASKEKRALMKKLKKMKLKHSGDFGVFALGFYNGQTGNNYDKNKKFHVVTRFSYPFEVGNQILEAGVQAYSGKYVLPKISKETSVEKDLEYIDQRVAGTFVLYPKPFGVQAEYNFGKGPEYDTSSKSIKTKNLHGGYATVSYFIKKWNHTFIPFARFQHYKGGKKHELDARSYNVKEIELGIEWHPYKAVEFVAMYTYSDRKYQDFLNPNYAQAGSLIRLQAQIKF